MKNIFLYLISFLCFFQAFIPVYAQQKDSNTLHTIIHPTIIEKPFSDSVPTTQKKISFNNTVIPVSLITYGFIARGSEALKKLDTSIKKSVLTSHVHTTIDDYLQYTPGLAVFVLNAAGIKGKHNFRDRTVTFLFSTILLSITAQSLKKITKELRPNGSDNSSFPSGHTATAFAGAEFLYQEYKNVSPWYGIAGYTIATATGVLRLYNNEHWFHDVIAGAGIGILSTKIAYWLEPKISKLLFHKQANHKLSLVNY